MKVLITPRGFANYGLDEVKLMESKGLEVDYNDTGKAYSAEQFLQKAKDADAIIVGVDDMSEPVMKQLPKLKVVCKFGVGVDNIDCDGIDVCGRQEFVSHNSRCQSGVLGQANWD